MKKSKKNTKKLWIDPDDAPELTQEWFDKAHVYKNGVLVKKGRGRPPIESPKISQTLRIDADVLEAFKETGAGWQTRMNEALRQAAKRLN
jgi:uncharacterized protein (DUF4415 family)